MDLTIAGMRASTTLSAGRAWCVPKAVLLAACCRVLGIPARLGYADVRNHLATERLKRLMNTDVFYWHGYTDIFIDGRWVKATPAFNIELCHRFQLKPLEFDGSADSLFHPFDMTGQLHMEYIRYHGTFADAPLDRIKASFEKYYGLLLAEEPVDFEREIVAEQSRQFRSMSVKRPLKILHVLSQRPDSTGSGVYVQALLREAAGNGHRNFLVAGIQAGSPPELTCIDPNDCRFVTFNGGDIPFTITGMSDVMPYESTRFGDLSSAQHDAYEKAFSRHLQAAATLFQPDIIHSHHLWLVTALTRRLFPHIPLVTTCHGSDLRQFQNCPHLRQRILSECRAIDAVMALSHAQKQDIVQLYGISPDRVHVVGAGYNDQRFTPAPKPLPVPVQVVYAGKLSHAKGVPWMLEALAGIDQPEWHLHLVGGGSGSEKAHCLALADRLGTRVTIHGPVSQQRLAEIMQSSHLFVLPSLFEGLPLVILEALASGCRIIATGLPG
ncbi:glycosyltransferase [Desulfosarcina cetonica]|uniref:glycosyltransferase n=1 Tax=Desulfosarcina cetonica TaxID=90730 RepID=UPI0006D1B63E|nr:glycosyltransferase [Desulfosarcina cetonica]